MMRSFFRQDFVWQFVGGFALGAVALVAVQPSEARHVLARHFVPHMTASTR